jgi:hypothetical protein
VESSFSFGPLVQTAEFYKIMTRFSKGLEYSKKKKTEKPSRATSRRYQQKNIIFVRTAKKEIRVKI